MKYVSIVIPAHNEKKNIKNTIVNILESVKNSKIIVVCNNCNDDTFSIVERLRQKNDNILNLNFTDKIGKGGAIIEGFKLADGDYIGFVDGDNAFFTSDLLGLINELGKSDCAIASKWLNRGFFNVNESFFKKISGRIWNFYVNILFDLSIKDTQAGMKFFRKRVLDRVIPEREFICTGFDFDVELLGRVKKNGFSIKEIPVNINKSNKRSSFSYPDSLKMMLNLARCRFFP